MATIYKITALETYLVRHPILRMGKPLASCEFDGDNLDTTSHFGLYENQELIGVISLFKKEHASFTQKIQYQIRGMAVLENERKKGHGEALVIYCEHYCKLQNADLIWFNARTVATGFYEKLGYKKIGIPFEINGVGEHSLMFKKIKNE